MTNPLFPEIDRCALVGMVHLKAMPGAPGWQGSMARVVNSVRAAKITPGVSVHRCRPNIAVGSLPAGDIDLVPIFKYAYIKWLLSVTPDGRATCVETRDQLVGIQEKDGSCVHFCIVASLSH